MTYRVGSFLLDESLWLLRELGQIAWAGQRIGRSTVYKSVERLRQLLQGAQAEPVIRTEYGGAVHLELAVGRIAASVPVDDSERVYDGETYHWRLLVLPFQSGGMASSAQAQAIARECSARLRTAYLTLDYESMQAVGPLCEVTALAREVGIDSLVCGRVEQMPAGISAAVRIVHATTHEILGAASVRPADAGLVGLPGSDRIAGLLAMRIGMELFRLTVEGVCAPAHEGPGSELLATLPAVFSFRRKPFTGALERLYGFGPHGDDLGFGLHLHRTLAHSYDYWSDVRESQERAVAAAELGAQRTEQSGAMVSLLAAIRAWRGEHDAAVATARRARVDGADGYLVLWLQGYAYGCAGRTAEAIDCMRRSLALVPEHPMAFNVHFTLARAHAVVGDCDAALRHAALAHVRNPRFPEGILWLAVGFALSGRLEEARSTLAGRTRMTSLAAAHRLRPARGQAWEKPLRDGLARLGLHAPL